jgi:hypothetical protein
MVSWYFDMALYLSRFDDSLICKAVFYKFNKKNIKSVCLLLKSVAGQGMIRISESCQYAPYHLPLNLKATLYEQRKKEEISNKSA